MGTNNYYKPKNILITGAAGFIASHVCNRLVRNYPEYNIVVLDKLDYCSNLKNLIIPSHSSSSSSSYASSQRFKFIKGDIGSADLVNYILLTESIDTIMHFAAQTHVDNSFGNSFEFTKNNIYGTHVLLEACKVIGGQVKRFIHVSTDEVYGETEEDAIVGNHEASQLLPTNPYSATKAGAEMLVMAYGRSYGLPVITTRGNNVYGPNQFPEKLIPKFILLAMKGHTLPIHGDGSNVRSYLYCEDVAEAFEIILHKGEVGHVYNIGTKKERRVIDVARDICKLFSLDPITHVKFVENRPFNDQRYFLDDEKLKKLGWFERTTWEEGLKKTMDWYIKNPNYWGDVSGALVPHPRMLTMPGVEIKYNDDAKDNDSNNIVVVAPNNSNIQNKVLNNNKMSTPITKKSTLKFLVYGGSGWIGGILGNICEKQGIPFEFGKGNLDDKSQILDDIRNIKPTHIFNASGVNSLLNMKWFEANKTETIHDIVLNVLTLAEVCRKYGIPLMNYAFGGSFEDSPNSSDSFYFKTQAKVEEFLKEYENVCTLRIQMPVSSDLTNPQNLITKITRSDKVANIQNKISVLDELLPISIEMAKRKCRGTWNFTNPGTVTCNEILEMYKDYVDPSFKWVNFSSLLEQQQVQFHSQSIDEMDALKLKQEFPEILDVKDSLVKYVFEPKRKSLGY